MDVEDWLNSNLTLCELQVVSETSTAKIKVRSSLMQTSLKMTDALHFVKTMSETFITVFALNIGYFKENNSIGLI